MGVTVPREALEYLTKEINETSRAAQAQVRAVLEALDWSDVAAARSQLVSAMQEACAASADTASVASAEFYDEVRSLAGVAGTYHASPDSQRDPAATEGAVRALVGKVVDGGPVESFNRDILSRVDYETKRASNACVAANARKDPAKPKYARVPAGIETCSFCIMLASRGFVYSSEGAAEHAHAGCDCRVVPGFGGMGVAGYDPEAYYKQWKAGNLKDEDKLSKRINSAWQDFKQAETPESYRRTLGRLIAEMSSKGPVDARYRAKPLAKELVTARCLSSNGHRVTFLPERSGYRVKNPDILLDGRTYDIKRVESSNPSKIYQNVARASDQAERFVIDLRISRISVQETKRVARAAVESHGTSAKEIILLFADGEETSIR